MSTPNSGATAAAALAAPLPVDDEPICLNCRRNHGLCRRHERDVLPQPRINKGWLWLMGHARVEQRARQSVKVLPISPEHADYLERRRASKRSKVKPSKPRGRPTALTAANKTARSSRRGYYGLAKAIANPTPLSEPLTEA
jgi:hypothetical protein